MEWKSELCPWTRTILTRGSEFSHGLNKLVANLNNKDQDDNEQETSEMQFEDYALKSNARAFRSRSKAKAKPQRRTSASSSTKTFRIGARTWTDVEPGKQSLSDFPVSKKLINLLRHGSLPREDDGTIEFWRIKDNLQNHFVYSQHWSDEKWKSSMAGGGGHKKKFSIVLMLRNNSVPPSSSRSFRTQSYWSFITGQCHYLGRILQVHLSRRMCSQFTFHHQFRVDTGRTKFEQTTDSVLSACGSHGQRTQDDPDTIDLEAPRLAQYMHKAWKKHQNTVYWVDINLAQKKGLKFYQTGSNAIILYNMQIMIERGDPLWLDNQSVRPQRSTRWTSTSEFLDCHMQLWNKPKILVFVRSRRRSRITLIDKLFKTM